jgi:hypothetical protein
MEAEAPGGTQGEKETADLELKAKDLDKKFERKGFHWKGDSWR